MIICEEFDSLQGEGKYIGVPTRFIRTTGCNLRCAWKNADGALSLCDTPYSSWKPEKGRRYTPEKTIDELRRNKIRHVVITGGEPTMQGDLPDICNLFLDEQYAVTVETNGTKHIEGLERAFMSISPKLKSSYQASGRALRIHEQNNVLGDQVRHWMKSNDYQLKFVVNEEEDIGEIGSIVNRLGALPDKVYLMPQGVTLEQFDERNPLILEACKTYGFHYTHRLQIYLFGNKRGT